MTFGLPFSFHVITHSSQLPLPMSCRKEPMGSGPRGWSKALHWTYPFKFPLKLTTTIMEKDCVATRNLFICSFIPGFIIWPNILYVCLYMCWSRKMFELACFSGHVGWQLLKPSAMFASSYKRKHSLFGAVLLFFFLSWFKRGNMFPSRDVRLPPSPSMAKND